MTGQFHPLIKITRTLSYTSRHCASTIASTWNCAAVTPAARHLPDAGYTRIDGSGGIQQSVIAVVGNYPSTVRLAGLEIVGGDAEDHEYGGAVYARHGGLLAIAASSIHNNRAGYGGGIAIEGRGTELALRDDGCVQQFGHVRRRRRLCRDGSIYANARGTGFFNNNALNEGADYASAIVMPNWPATVRSMPGYSMATPRTTVQASAPAIRSSRSTAPRATPQPHRLQPGHQQRRWLCSAQRLVDHPVGYL